MNFLIKVYLLQQCIVNDVVIKIVNAVLIAALMFDKRKCFTTDRQGISAFQVRSGNSVDG